jgi:hypothetical protein
MVIIYEMFRRVIWANLLQLNSQQSILFHNYCKLVSNRRNDLDPISQVEEIQSIWSKAVEDPHLSTCLEMIDYFIGAENFEIDLERIAYLEEYLQEVVEKSIMEYGGEDLLIEQRKLALEEQKLALEEGSSLHQKDLSESHATKSIVGDCSFARTQGLALVDENDPYQQPHQEITSSEQAIETIIDMISLKIKELKNTASELATETVIKIIN